MKFPLITSLIDRLSSRASAVRTRHHPMPVCSIKVDLRRIPWGDDLSLVEQRLLQAPGAVGVRLQPGRRRAILFHDERTSLPELWDWLQLQGWRPR